MNWCCFNMQSIGKNISVKQIKPYIKGYVLEVGAGIGATTLLLK